METQNEAQEPASVTVDGVPQLIEELGKDGQGVFAHVVLLRRKRDEAGFDKMIADRATDHAEKQLVDMIREHRNKALEGEETTEETVVGEVV